MRNECVELNELVSAYADGELAGAELQRVEGHLASCEECRAFVSTCRRIDHAVAEELRAPAVEGARWDAMYAQLSAATASRAEKRKWRFHPAKAIAFVSTFAAAMLLAVAVVRPGKVDPHVPDGPVNIEIEPAEGDYQVVTVAAPEGGISMVVVIDNDPRDEKSGKDPKDDKKDDKDKKGEKGEKSEGGEK